ncbi:helix-turn-helix domain-containing protein [Streptobacillus felis]|uniref:Helix-turn-helix domain-containing protein n=1 Tax=Streptobacillus felis TaxID=1384509 RepID=A0A7Z0T6W6_9FUSO|nr:helix-turn-helix domain-containing protein [Streptobacillus felis]NYV27666.1 helix-turn-helix domain-containing protein [Streptobacillus felis]
MGYFSDNTFNQSKRSVSIVTKLIDEVGDKTIHTTHRFAFIVSGSGKVKLNEIEYIIKENSLISISPWSTTEITEVSKPMNVLIFSYNKSYISRIVNHIRPEYIDIFNNIEKMGEIDLDGREGTKIKKILLEIRNEIGDDNILECVDNFIAEAYSEIFIISKFLEFFVVISRNNKKNKVEDNNYSEAQLLIKYIHAHSNEKLTINKLALTFFMSESTVRRYIEEFTDLTFNELLYKIRLSKTEDLLLYTNLSLDEIANLSGFVDGSHITKIWNMKKNMTPTAYRNSYKESFKAISEEDRKVVFELINYIDKEYMQDLKIETIAKKFEISEIKINKLLLSYVDRNFSTYLNHIRINKACELLINTDTPIIDICFEVGYNNIKSFNNNFKKNKNMTPTCFREYQKK